MSSSSQSGAHLSQTSSSAQLLVGPNGESLFDYKRKLLKILAKFQYPHTTSIANDELRKFMTVEITDHEHMVLFLSVLGDFNDHMKLQQKKEQLKNFGVAAEIFEEALIPYLPKTLASLAKKVTE